jgi:hypothetical protein
MSLREALNDIAPSPEPSGLEAVVEDEVEPERGAAPGSILESLRARAQQLQAEKHIDLEIPGYHGQLWGRYRAVSLARTLTQAGEVNPMVPKWTVAADTLARALEAVYYRNEHGELQPLYPEPVRYDDELVEMLNLRPAERSARAVLVALCGGGNLGESRVWTHYMAYQGWLMAGDEEGETLAQEVARATVGEYPAD